MPGALTWYIPDCYWPAQSTPGEYVSHESICVLNTGDQDAHLHITLYFEDRAPQSGFITNCAAQRTHHVRMDHISDLQGQSIPRGVPYAALVMSDVPVIVQYSRCDVTQPALTLMTTVAYPVMEGTC